MSACPVIIMHYENSWKNNEFIPSPSPPPANKHLPLLESRMAGSFSGPKDVNAR